ncbi:MAG: hypothetical protein IPH62_06815 [Ignavibacteriae bacterium]|nr:hypothetical protein [Ignavibacteriota bacterium]
MKRILISILLLTTLISCGTTSSIDSIHELPNITIELNNNEIVNGKLVQDNYDKLIIIKEPENWEIEYLKNEIKEIKVEENNNKKTNEEKKMEMMRDIVRNTSRAATNTGLLLTIYTIGIIAAIASIASK